MVERISKVSTVFPLKGKRQKLSRFSKKDHFFVSSNISCFKDAGPRTECNLKPQPRGKDMIFSALLIIAIINTYNYCPLTLEKCSIHLAVLAGCAIADK